MKIIVLGTRGFPDVQGGIEKHCEELYPRLVELGCEVVVLARAPYTGPNMYSYKGVTVLPMACPKHKYLEAFLHTFLGVIKARMMNPDVVHIHAIGPSLFVPFARLLRLKVVMTHHGPDYDRKKWNSFAKWILRLGEELGINYAHHVIAISKVIARSVGQEFAREVTTVPNGVNIYGRVMEDGTLQRFGITRGKYILAVGRFVPEKGFGDLVEGFHRLLKWNVSAKDWKLVLVGDADHADEYSRSLKEQCARTSNVVLTGFQSGVALKELYTHAGHFILPSYHEGLPIVLLEALSYGSSCLVSDIPANREVGLRDERYFKPGDIDQISDKINAFMEKPANDLQRQSRMDFVKEKYNWEKIAQKTVNVYHRVEHYGGISVVDHEESPVFSFGNLAPEQRLV